MNAVRVNLGDLELERNQIANKSKTRNVNCVIVEVKRVSSGTKQASAKSAVAEIIPPIPVVRY